MVGRRIFADRGGSTCGGLTVQTSKAASHVPYIVGDARVPQGQCFWKSGALYTYRWGLLKNMAATKIGAIVESAFNTLGSQK